MKPGEAFLGTFSRLENWMRRRLRRDEAYPYKRMVQDLRSAFAITESQYEQLISYGYLRNALAHWQPNPDGIAIADPRPDTLAQFEALAARVMEPALALDVLGNQEVIALDVEAPVEDFLDIVRERDFSQVPVLADGRYQGVLTVGAIARWLAKKRWNEPGDFRKARIATVPRQEFEDPEFVERGASLTAPEALAEFFLEAREVAISGIVVVDRGLVHDVVRAVIVPWDIPSLLRVT
jgi:hypothetical protein